MQFSIEQDTHFWNKYLSDQFELPYFKSIKHKLEAAEANDEIYYPPYHSIFTALDKTKFEDVKVIILGQDPYHNEGQAMGLSFAVPHEMKRPPSLLKIYKEIHRDLGHPIPTHGDISPWADQGVLLLNAILTVEAHRPGSHKNIGWEILTDHIIRLLNDQKENLVFMLWGNFARSKSKMIHTQKHLVLESAHPSPLAGNAFYGNSHFSRCNAYLIQYDKSPIDWKIEDTILTLF